jgi:hypothetical protein
MKQILAVVLALALCRQSTASPNNQMSAREQLSAWPAGTRIMVTLKDGKVTRGSLGPVDSTGFTVLTGRSQRPRFLNFADVNSLAAEPKKHVLIERHNE